MLVEIMKFGKEEKSVVTSLNIAETFEKEHKNVLKDIRELECSEEFSRLNFEPTTYKDKFNREQPMYYVTRDGFRSHNNLPRSAACTLRSGDFWFLPALPA